MLSQGRRAGAWPASLAFACASGWIGCASPGAPRPPTLHLPGVVQDLSAVRSGNTVELQFSVPSRTTDGQAMRPGYVYGILCRQDAAGEPCKPVDGAETSGALPIPHSSTRNDSVVWTDPLPPRLVAGSPRVLAYKVEIRSTEGRSAGPSDAAYVAAGAAPPPVEGFRAEGTRLGVLLQWAPSSAPGELLLERRQIDPKPAPYATEANVQISHGEAAHPRGPARPAHTRQKDGPGVLWLHAEEEHRGTTEIMDNAIQEGVRYDYVAVRRVTVRVGARSLEMRSAPTEPSEIAWHDVYPPPAPLQLTALGYTSRGESGSRKATEDHGYAVDLIWQPVNDPRLTGYLVTRQRLGRGGQAVDAPERLTQQPVAVPGFHDAAAVAGQRYQYAVTAVDARGNVSAAATTEVGLSDAP